MQTQALLFDLDGTLADTALDLGGALNDLLHQKGLPEKSLTDIRPYAAHGSAALLQFGANITPQMPEFDAWQQHYLALYGARSTRDTVLFPDVNTVLLALQKHNIRWGIVTNKHARFTDVLVPKLGFVVPPDVVVSGDTCPQAKPSPEPLLYACEQLNVLPEHCWYVGDAQRDIQAGKNAGMKTILAAWGYITQHEQPETWQSDYLAHNMNDLLSLLSLI
ncbi:MAG: HAD family hydrolase [Alysiella sp.]|uniref:HAD family hydrolase n=1 Tax=Alysiella sp. TaxID=1872483 RepID=UPI0026DC6F61|nr:HAD family hydrolase [Alysiella sp.]MDO4433428.1 HAD family hydrolase [Alysiella sp.]